MSWYPEDKQWLKERKQKWKQTKVTIDELSIYKASDKKCIKEYFLYGPDKEPLTIYRRDEDPGHKVEATGLLAVWFHPADDKNVIMQELKRFLIKDRTYEKTTLYYDGPERFEEYSHGSNMHEPTLAEYIDFAGVSPFQGREQLLCNLLLPKVIEHENWFESRLAKAKEVGDFSKFEDETTYKLGQFVDVYRTKELNEHYALRFRVPYVISCLKYAIDENRLVNVLPWLFDNLEKIKRTPELYQPCQIATAEEFEHLLNKAEIPDAVMAILNKHRALAIERIEKGESWKTVRL